MQRSSRLAVWKRLPSLHRAGELIVMYFRQKLFVRFAVTATWLAALLAMLFFTAPRVAARLLGHVARSSVHTGVAAAGAVIEEAVSALEMALDFETDGNCALTATKALEATWRPRWLVLLLCYVLPRVRFPGLQ